MPDEEGNGLPRLFTVRGFEGSLGDYIDQLYWQYRAMVSADIRLWGRPITSPGETTADGRDYRFWHLITAASSGHTEATRTLNLKRCAHLPRVWDILERLARDDLHVCWWREGPTVFVAPVDFSMVVVLSERRGAYQLKAAFPTEKRKKTNRWFGRAARAWAAGECWHPVVDDRHQK